MAGQTENCRNMPPWLVKPNAATTYVQAWQDHLLLLADSLWLACYRVVPRGGLLSVVCVVVSL